MAYAPMRSMNAELDTGIADGTYKEVVRDRGGFVERTTYDSRSSLHDMSYGIHEAPTKEVATKIEHVTTQNCRATPEAQPWH
jgi:hypothetical protein